MNSSITCVFQLSIQSEKFVAFELLIQKVVAETKMEAGTLSYFYSVNETQQQVHIVEQYADAVALRNHIDTTFAPFASEFLSLVKVQSLTVYGKPDIEARKRLDNFGAVYLEPFAGFISR